MIKDWAGIVSFEPGLQLSPSDQGTLRAALDSIKDGVHKGKRIRVPGGLHSCAKILVSDAILDLRSLPKDPLQFSNDDKTVTVSANWTLHDFLEELGTKKNKSITATGGTDEQTLAGLLTTNTAPASSRFAIFETLEQVKYVTYDAGTGAAGDKVVSRGDPEFSSVVCSLGAIGIITQMQFSLIDQPFFETVQRIAPLDEVLGDLDETSRKFDFWRIDWLPKMDMGLLWTATQVPGSPANEHGDYPPDVAVTALQFIFERLDDFTRGRSGPLLGLLEWFVYVVMAAIYPTTKVTGPLRNMIPVDRRAPFRVAMAEWCFHPDDLTRVRNECKAFFRRRGWPNLPIEIELTKTDDYHMSSWNWPELKGEGNKNYVVKFNFMYLTDVCKNQDELDLISIHLLGLWEHLTQAGIQFKAHWGKINFIDHDFVNTHYPGYGAFKTHTHDEFKNAYLDERLPP
ncbi:D-arabinono-1,4-lactone oxidase [Archangium violaceum]|uniref:D-arabinono-1,4-lactone oxidase n=1 Tax=Archangium violaceum TaxID=83451 RepID=UPI0036DEEB0B